MITIRFILKYGGSNLLNGFCGFTRFKRLENIEALVNVLLTQLGGLLHGIAGEDSVEDLPVVELGEVLTEGLDVAEELPVLLEVEDDGRALWHGKSSSAQVLSTG